MKKEVNHNIRKCFNEIIYNTARYTEIILSVVILIVIALAGISMIHDITRISLWDMDIDFLRSFCPMRCRWWWAWSLSKCCAGIPCRMW